ncbi:hypothetical protein NBT05_07635 [Aquimarina sp. ERC-38]|uniref:hypothetical protein n=1 Tax=Aquimarina sp. ERC-38 TaxID=2949996 RepID=UPI0022464AC0|nr:hypothetical protein [Aquimarina sp. ERC-38]UZO82337.1 hypothetical protein NBT05_07635 [Aquimarina sp. ERC-38]
MNQVIRRCPYCTTENLDRDYCKNCGKLINTILKRKLEREQKLAAKQQEAANEKPNKITEFFENARVHKNPMVRYPAKAFYSIWVIVLAVGSFLAFVLTYVAA